MRLFSLILMTVLMAAPAARAQQDSVFGDYADYTAFVDKAIMTRDFTSLILRLGGRDEYSPEEVAKNDAQLKRIWPSTFRQVTVFKREDLGGGVFQEGRMYWTGMQYAYFYAMLHEREDAFVVISFHLNTNSKKVMERF